MRMPRVDPKAAAMIAGLVLLAKDGMLRLLWVGGVLIDIVLRAVMMPGILIGVWIAGCLILGERIGPGGEAIALAGMISGGAGALRALWMGPRKGCDAKSVWSLASGKEDFLKMAELLEIFDSNKHQIAPAGIGTKSSIAKSAGYLFLSPGIAGRGLLIGLPVVLALRACRAVRRIRGASGGQALGLAAKASMAAKGGAFRVIERIGAAASERGSEALSRIEKARLEEVSPSGRKAKDRKGL